MDEYGQFTNNKEDYATLAQQLLINKSILFPYTDSEDGATSYNICISKFKKIGTLSWGGNPSGYMVSIIKIGAFWFKFEKEFYSDYVSEKLNLSEYGAKSVCKLLNGIREELNNALQ